MLSKPYLKKEDAWYDNREANEAEKYFPIYNSLEDFYDGIGGVWNVWQLWEALVWV